MRHKQILVLALMLLMGGTLFAQVKIGGNLYGGCELGNVTGNTQVEYNGGTTQGSLYGGGMGTADNEQTGCVRGNTTVTMTNGTVARSIYGGGEMGSVGTFTESYSAGESPLHVEGEPKTCQSGTGVAKVTVSGNSVVGVIDQAIMPPPDPEADDYGYIFCGSRGEADSIRYENANKLAVVDSTYLEIGGNALVTSSVYGGCENGLVLRNTYVKITGNCQIGVGYHKVDNNHVFDPVYTAAQWTSRNPAHFHEVSHWPYRAPYEPYDPYADEVGYDSHGGSTSATNGHSFYGNVYGGGSGYYAIEPSSEVPAGTWRRSAGRVCGNTHVVVDGGHILNNLYGGNEMTDVLGRCTVDMSGGTLGVPRTLDSILARPVSCYLFGAGKGDERIMFNKMTNVQSVTVNVTGGRIFGSIFGGGEDGHVLGDITVNVALPANDTLGTLGTSYVDGNVFGGGRGFSGTALTAGNVGGDITVNISSGHILGSVYGGGRLGSVGYDLCNTNEACYGVMSSDPDRGNITVNITGGIIGNDDASDYGQAHSRGGNVFGGSMGRLTKLDGTLALPIWHKLGAAKSTTVNLQNDTWVKGNVYGGSELGTVTEDITVNISGNVTVGRKAASTTTSHGNVYGGGVGRDVLSVAERAEVASSGVDDATATSDSIPTFAGLTGGTIQVNISGGAINNNVYGGGELSSVGTIASVNKHTDSATTYYLSWPYEYTYHGTSGDARVNITGGTIGYRTGSTTSGGDIYGSARGTVGDRYVTGRLATARVTHVDINLAASTDTIFGTVYGSGENGHVYDSAVVTLRNGLVLGSVFGGGKGTDTYTDQLKNPTTGDLYNAEVYDIIAGKVFGNTKVNILGGRVAKNVYGGGDMASVGKGNYKKYGEGPNVSSADSLLAEESGHCYVNILGGVIGPDSILAGTRYNESYAIPDGHVYGAGKGIVFPAAAKVGYAYNRDYYVAYVNKTHVIIGDSTNRSCDYTTVLTPHVTGNVFGGGENGHVRFDTYVQTNSGIIGVRPLASGVTSDQGHWTNRGNVWGAGRGEDTNTDGSYCQSAGSVTRNTTIDIFGARIYRNIQGGGAMASVGPIKGRTGDSSTCVINVRLPLAGDTIGGGKNTNNAFGGYLGGGSRGIPSPDGTDNSALATCHNSQINFYRGRLKNTPYGGGENGQMLGNTEINVYGGYIRSAIYGGGKGCWKASAAEAGMPGTYENDTLSGYIAGNTLVNLLGGQVPFVYGGCRRANVGGNATINIGKDNGDGTYSGDASFIVGKDKVYGGNQYAGSPRGNIYVNVYKTAHTTTDAATYTENDGVNGAPKYAINYVYGGSYNSPYLPKDSGHYAQVHIYGCDNTVDTVYGGCAAANAGARPGIGASTKLIIDGGRFGAVFGGGDGTYDRYLGRSVPANIYGTANTEIHGGTFGSLYGGSNTNGAPDTICITLENDGPCGDTIRGDEFFGGSNVAALGPIVLSSTLGCGVKFNAAYGGSNQADVIGDVTLNIQGGTIGKVFGGSKGVNGGTAANIDGNVTVNVTGGTLGYVYGGSNLNGNITGKITVTVDSIQGTCPLTIKNDVYGASYITRYNPNDSLQPASSKYSPVVSIKHGTVGGNVFGGGDGTGAATFSNPRVRMGGIDTLYTGADSIHNSYKPVVKGNIYGGGNLARVMGSTRIDMLDGTVDESIFGGGKGTTTHIDSGLVAGNTIVAMNAGKVLGNIYGGGELGTVGTIDAGGRTDITVSGGTVGLAIAVKNNDDAAGDSLSFIYGGGKGKDDDINGTYKNFATVKETHITVSGGQVGGSVFGGGEDGHVLGHTNVTISNTTNNAGAVVATPVIGTGGFTHELDGCVLGGGRNTRNNLNNRGAGRVLGNTYVTVTGGRICRSVFGGGALGRVGVDADGSIVDAGNISAMLRLKKKNSDVDSIDGSGNYIYDSVNHGYTFIDVSGTTDTVLGERKTRYNYAHQAVADSLGFVDEDSTRFANFLTTTYCIPGTDSIVVFYTTIGCPDDSTLVDNDYTIGDIFGGGKGDTKDTADIFAGRVMNTSVRVHGSPRIMADIYAGGEMSCIGWYDTTGANRDEYYDNTGYTHVNVSGSPYGGTPFEFSETNIHGGRAWTLIDSTGRLYHTCSGNIYGGGQGYVEEGYRRIHNWVQMGRVRRTDVQVSGGRFLGNVFGGGSRGIVKEDCVVKITGGHFGTVITDTKNTKGDKLYYYGSVFGGGYGNPKTFWHYNDSCFIKSDGSNVGDTVLMRPTEFAGRVYGNTYVTVSGGRIMKSVYGGGDLASTGWVERDANGKFQFDDTTKHHGGLCTVNINGTAVVGPLDGTEMSGNVYGAGKGVGADPDEIYKTYCNANRTSLTVSGGHIYGSTFGGGSDAHVLGSAYTYISDSADIGSGEPFDNGNGGYSHEYDGCVFGGGRNATNINHTAGRVQGNTNIFVTGGRIRRSVIGGGALARTGVDTAGVITPYIKANGYDSLYHGHTFIDVSGTTETLPGSIQTAKNYYGRDTNIIGFANATDSVKYARYLGTTDTMTVGGAKKVVVYLTSIGAPDCTIIVENDYTIGDIFGGGKGDTKDTVDILAGRVMNTSIKVHGSPRIMADIYAGAEMACVGWYDTTGANTGKYYDNTGYTRVVVSDSPYTGTPYEFSQHNIHAGRKWTLIDSIGRLYHTCSGNVYGGGQGYVEQDATHRHNWVQMGRVRKTDVTINGGRFMGNIFGGGSRGFVMEDCDVKVNGGTIGCVITDNLNPRDDSKRYYYGSVFGGGYGNHKVFLHKNDSCFVKTGNDTVLMMPIEMAGRVYGNTEVTVKGGHIMNCVFGGGDMASTGWVERNPANGDYYYDTPAKRHGGICTVSIEGGEIGPLDMTGHNAYVYGAGKGIPSDSTDKFKHCANVNETHLTVKGGKIWGSTFGGGPDSHVLGDVHTKVTTGADLGTRGITSYDGNIFGAGRNYLNTNHTNGRVQGNIYILMDGGSIKGTIFGGGRLALSGVDSVGHFIDSTHGNVDIIVRGNATIGTSHADSLLYADQSCGDIFGSGKGDILNYEDVWAGRVTNAKITVKDTVISENTYSPRIYGSVFGGGEMASVGWWDDTITDGSGNIVFHTNSSDFTNPGTTYGTNWTIIYAGTGTSEINISGNVTVGSSLEYTVNPADNPGDWTIYNERKDTLIHTCTGNVFGGCQGDVDVSAPRWISMGRMASTVVNISGGNFMGNVFGGSEQGIVTGDTRVNISGGTFGIDGLGITPNSNLDKYYSGDIYAAGYGSDDPTEWGDTTWNDSTAASKLMHLGWSTGLLSGRTFGDSRVDVLGGTIYGSVYGGGSYASVGDDKPMSTVEPYASLPVNGVTTVNIGLPGAQDDGSDAIGSATIYGYVFGGNNFRGTPYGNTNVNIYRTAHTDDDYLTVNSTLVVEGNQYPSGLKALAEPDNTLTDDDLTALYANDADSVSFNKSSRFALAAVYGGGNRAAHAPIDNVDGTTNVHVYYCNNTIHELYGGGNAANTVNNNTIVDGGRIKLVFGGGNGYSATNNHSDPNQPNYNPGADVNEVATTLIRGGYIDSAYAGSNQKGYVRRTSYTINTSSGCEEYVANSFGGGNNAAVGGGEITLSCGARYENFYAGANNADIGTAEKWANGESTDIVLNVEGGVYTNIYAGNNAGGTIYGNVTINFHGGNVENLFGGSSQGGNIMGSITVNVDIDPDYSCTDGLDLVNVYGGGENAEYRPYDPFRASPTVNIMNNRFKPSTGDSNYVHIMDVFGGGKGATATSISYPRVVVGGFGPKLDSTNTGTEQAPEWEVTTRYTRSARVYGNVYGGGDAAPVVGNTMVAIRNSIIGDTPDPTYCNTGTVFGGGLGTTARVLGETYIGIFGLSDIRSNVYGGGNAGIVSGGTEIQVGYEEQIFPVEIIAYLDNGGIKANFSTSNVPESLRSKLVFSYTTDGSEPPVPATNATRWNPNSPIVLDWNSPIKCIAYLENNGNVDKTMIPSVTSFDLATAPTISFNSDYTLATITNSLGSRIYYTKTGGTEPTTSSTYYGTVGEDNDLPSPTGPFAVGSNEVVRAITVMRGCVNSHIGAITAEKPTIEVSGNSFTITAPEHSRIIYTIEKEGLEVNSPISTMDGNTRPGEGVAGMSEVDDNNPEQHIVTASNGTVSHKKRTYQDGDDTKTYRWNEVATPASGAPSVTFTVPTDHSYTVKAIVETPGHIPSLISSGHYQP